MVTVYAYPTHAKLSVEIRNSAFLPRQLPQPAPAATQGPTVHRLSPLLKARLSQRPHLLPHGFFPRIVRQQKLTP